mmetsp:Transcript_13097/g.30597  ORF Transcript_13097/g.30597 Transcript_13097/m.30597 type:complete len:293 (+) Transcript_13097:190-1068(+)
MALSNPSSPGKLEPLLPTPAHRPGRVPHLSLPPPLAAAAAAQQRKSKEPPPEAVRHCLPHLQPSAAGAKEGRMWAVAHQQLQQQHPHHHHHHQHQEHHHDHSASWPRLAIAGDSVVLGDEGGLWHTASTKSVPTLRSFRSTTMGFRSTHASRCRGGRRFPLGGSASWSGDQQQSATSHHFRPADPAGPPAIDVAIKTVHTCCTAQLSHGVKSPVWMQLLPLKGLPGQEAADLTPATSPRRSLLGHPLAGAAAPALLALADRSSSSGSSIEQLENHSAQGAVTGVRTFALLPA